MYARGIQSFHYSSPAKITGNIVIFAEKKNDLEQSASSFSFYSSKELGPFLDPQKSAPKLSMTSFGSSHSSSSVYD